MKVGYARVSTEDQNCSGQIEALEKEGCEKIFWEKASGVKTERVELAKAIGHLRKNDTLVVYKLDRLGRSLKQLIEMVEKFEKEGIHFKSIDDTIDTSSATGTFFFHIIGAFSQLERGLIRERTRVGLTAARARGKYGGRPETHSQAKKELAYKMYLENKDTVDEISETLNLSRSTIYRVIEKKKAYATA